MSDGFSSPVVGGGGAIVRPTMHSPGFRTGVTGWSIDKDGTAEFNSLSIRGTFNGTDYYMDQNGLFMYKGTPGAGTLAVSLSVDGGTDEYGNTYLAGLVSYDVEGGEPVGFVQTIQGELIIGDVTDGVFQFGQAAAGVFAQSNQLTMSSKQDPANPATTADTAYLTLASGEDGQVTGGTHTPRATFTDLDSASPVDVVFSGSLIQTDFVGNLIDWTVPALGTGWATNSSGGGQQPFHTRPDGLNNTVLNGLFHSTSATPAATICTLAAHPALPQHVNVLTETSASVIAPAILNIATTGVVTISPAIAATGVTVYVSGNSTFPLGQLS